MALQTTPPACLNAGDTSKFTMSFADYGAPTWAAVIHLRGASSLDVTATADGTSHAFVITTAQSALLQPGTYSWAVRVSDGGELYTAAEGTLVVEANIALALAGDFVSHAERMLAAIDAVLDGRITADVESYSIGGRAVTKHSLTELKKLRQHFAWRLWMERNPGKFARIGTVTFV